MSAFVSELRAELRSRVHLVLWLTLSLVVSVSGPFGSHSHFSLIGRVLFWAPVLAVGVFLSIGVRGFVHGKLGLTDFRRGAVLATALVCLLICPPLFLLVSTLFSGNQPPLAQFQEIVLLVASVSLGVCSLSMAVVEPPQPDMDVPELAVQSAPDSRLLHRLDPELRGALWAISVRDHYVDVLTERGTTSLLMRFSDAMAEAGVAGAQVHRSHWVAWDAVEAPVAEGTRLFLQLKSGARVPVSKNHRLKLELHGLV